MGRLGKMAYGGSEYPSRAFLDQSFCGHSDIGLEGRELGSAV